MASENPMLTILCAAIVTVAVAIAAETRSQGFRNVLQNDIICSEALLMTSQLRSNLDCARRCFEIPGCLTFTFNKLSRSCRGHSAILTAGSSVISTGYRAYQVEGSQETTTSTNDTSLSTISTTTATTSHPNTALPTTVTNLPAFTTYPQTATNNVPTSTPLSTTTAANLPTTVYLLSASAILTATVSDLPTTTYPPTLVILSSTYPPTTTNLLSTSTAIGPTATTFPPTTTNFPPTTSANDPSTSTGTLPTTTYPPTASSPTITLPTTTTNLPTTTTTLPTATTTLPTATTTLPTATTSPTTTVSSGCTTVFDANNIARGYTVFQRRCDGSVNFNRPWADYVAGFGNPKGEYWMGLENLYQQTSLGATELRIDMELWDGTTAYAIFPNFVIQGSAVDYKLNFDSMTSVNVSDMLSICKGQGFTTSDRDNDGKGNGNCAQLYMAGFWFKNCGYSNPNAPYYFSSVCPNTDKCIY